MAELLNKKEVRKDAKELLKQGVCKQQVFKTLVEKYKYSIEVANILTYLPSQKAIKIDGNFIRFELINYKDDIYIYKNKDYTLKLEILKRKFIESELELEKGIITVHTPKGTVKQKFIGECGC